MNDEPKPDSRARQIQALKGAFLTIMNPEQLRQVTERLVAMALDGSIPAAKLLLDRAFDKNMIDGHTQPKETSIETRRLAAVEKFARNHGSV
ncbi:MAG: hypothetical protein NTW75_00025 [Planctomycetales bacterium]|jgi:hypothetical protein|nr:hypothetical protein [Planctomycetales bacterium]